MRYVIDEETGYKWYEDGKEIEAPKKEEIKEEENKPKLKIFKGNV